MRLHKRAENEFGLNTTSTADISFMLLIFFLVTSSMYVDKGLLRRLPPKESDTAIEQELLVDRENVMSLTLTATGEVVVNDSVADPTGLEEMMQAFILDRRDKHLFTIDAHNDCPYETYYIVQNALSEAYKKAREAVAQADFGCSMSLLAAADRAKLLTLLPHRVAESYKQEGER